jgi:ribose transport system substrate-binding protein
MSSTPTADQASKPKRQTHFGFLFVIALLAIGALWWGGAFTRKPKIAMVAGESAYFDMIVNGAREAEKQYDVNLVVIRAKGDAQADAVRNLVGQKYDGVAVSPYNPPGEAAILSDLAAQTTLVTFDSDSPLSNRLCFVGTDNYAAGRMCGRQARTALGDGGGEVLLQVGNLDKENTQRRREGVIDELLDRPFDADHPLDPTDKPLQAGKITVVATSVDTETPDVDIVADVAKAMKDHPNVKCIVGLNEYSAPNILKALEQAGMAGKVTVIGFDANPDTLSGIEAGTVNCSILQDQFGCGFHAVRILAENARGNRSGLPMFQRRTLPVEIINKDNVAAMRAQLLGEKSSGQSPAPASQQSATAAP